MHPPDDNATSGHPHTLVTAVIVGSVAFVLRLLVDFWPFELGRAWAGTLSDQWWLWFPIVLGAFVGHRARARRRGTDGAQR